MTVTVKYFTLTKGHLDQVITQSFSRLVFRFLSITEGQHNNVSLHNIDSNCTKQVLHIL